ncbi:AraC family transcriptional regulator [Paucibacter sp. M5-1]|uniref:AraC family transcriptional regulator n=1 Tax=Paucibacter sp. M5-1 TaxID=3015998 RepID=UPI0022B8C743|nr:AraC family transcriptional regulator [Paucibacter sp. M5-1]MCZ7881962.1 AraC family transcriptional regulator [Paucibacter sp. M5-1]
MHSDTPPAAGWQRDDPVGEALQFLRMSAVVYCHSEPAAPWGIQLPAMPGCLMFHIVLQGAARLELDGEPALQLQAGDFALLTESVEHRLLSAAGVECPDLFSLQRRVRSEWFEELVLGDGPGPRSELLCGALRVDDPASLHLLALLPPLLSVGAQEQQQGWFHSTLQLLLAEARARRPGHETVTTRLADILVVQALRGWLEQMPAAQRGWLRGLQDRQIARALAALHRRPGQAWSLETLAAEAGLSRSAFAERFSRLVDLPAMEYLTRWRIHLAATRLRRRPVPLARLADELGYASEAAFHRAFKRVMGVTPGSLRAPAQAESGDDGGHDDANSENPLPLAGGPGR